MKIVQLIQEAPHGNDFLGLADDGSLWFGKLEEDYTKVPVKRVMTWEEAHQRFEGREIRQPGGVIFSENVDRRGNERG